MDIETLVRSAGYSPGGEQYRAVYSSEGIKLGISAVMQPSGECQFFAELVINLCCRGRETDVEELDRAVGLIRSMKEAGYDISCDGGEFACEKQVPPNEIEDEVARIEELIAVHDRVCD